jgi:hypothetical protein
MSPRFPTDLASSASDAYALPLDYTQRWTAASVQAGARSRLRSFLSIQIEYSLLQRRLPQRKRSDRWLFMKPLPSESDKALPEGVEEK